MKILFKKSITESFVTAYRGIACKKDPVYKSCGMLSRWNECELPGGGAKAMRYLSKLFVDNVKFKE